VSVVVAVAALQEMPRSICRPCLDAGRPHPIDGVAVEVVFVYRHAARWPREERCASIWTNSQEQVERQSSRPIVREKAGVGPSAQPCEIRAELLRIVLSVDAVYCYRGGFWTPSYVCSARYRNGSIGYDMPTQLFTRVYQQTRVKAKLDKKMCGRAPGPSRPDVAGRFRNPGQTSPL